jgi:hypothetical protein
LVSIVDQYAWSSHQGYVSWAGTWDWMHKDFILKILTDDKTAQKRKYRQFAGQSDSEKLYSFYEMANLPSMLGAKNVIVWVKERFFEGRIEREILLTKTLAPERGVIKKAVCKFYGVAESDLIAVKRGIRNKPRDVVIYLMRTVCGDPLMPIGC